MPTGLEVIAKAKSYIGELHDGADVPMMAAEIGRIYPEFKTYGKQATTSTPWCGIFAAYVVSQLGAKPPATDSSGVGYMWVDTWRKWGTPVSIDKRLPGDAALYLGNPHHINFVSDEPGKYVGGNQSDGVTEATYRTPDYILRAPTTSSEPVPVPTPHRFNVCIERVLVHEGGNVQHPADPGGRTSRGITAERWAEWRQTHPGLPEDVWDAPQTEVLAIYREKYWDVMECDSLPAGVDYAVFDFGVNSGPARSARFLQEIVGTDVDGEIGPLTIAVTKAADAETIINRLCDDRMTFLMGLATWNTFGRGWTNRVNDVRRDALADVGTAPSEPVDDLDDTPSTNAAVEAALKDVVSALRPILEKYMEPKPVATQSTFDWGKLLQPILAELAPKILPMLMPLIIQMLPSLLPYILDAMFKPKQSVMSKPGVQASAAGGIGAIIGGLITAYVSGKVPQ